MSRIAVIDFETTGLSPAMGDRATEVAIVVLEDGKVVDRYQSLMNAGVRIPAFIETFTGITNAMIAQAPSAEQVMSEAGRFVGNMPMAAHNAAFDRKFWLAELARTDVPGNQPFACTLLLSRRIYPDAGSHRLGALAELYDLPFAGRAHRALADAEVAAALLARMQRDLCRRFDLDAVEHPLLVKLQGCPRGALVAAMRKHLATAVA